MLSNIEILDNKVNFLTDITNEVSKYINEDFDFATFVINNNLTSTQVVLIIKALTIMNYRRFGILDEYVSDFQSDLRFSSILKDSIPTFNDFKEFIDDIDACVDIEDMLNSLINQKIGKNICKFLLEDKANN